MDSSSKRMCPSRPRPTASLLSTFGKLRTNSVISLAKVADSRHKEYKDVLQP